MLLRHEDDEQGGECGLIRASKETLKGLDE